MLKGPLFVRGFGSHVSVIFRVFRAELKGNWMFNRILVTLMRDVPAGGLLNGLVDGEEAGTILMIVSSPDDCFRRRPTGILFCIGLFAGFALVLVCMLYLLVSRR